MRVGTGVGFGLVGAGEFVRRGRAGLLTWEGDARCLGYAYGRGGGVLRSAFLEALSEEDEAAEELEAAAHGGCVIGVARAVVRDGNGGVVDLGRWSME